MEKYCSIVDKVNEYYERCKKCPSILLEHDEILILYPEYYEIRDVIEHTRFPYRHDICLSYGEKYKSSSFYKELEQKGFTKEQIDKKMQKNKHNKIQSFQEMFDSIRTASLNLCNLIDYIGHYPDTYPVPKDDEKDEEMEKLLEQYDIMVRWYEYDEFKKPLFLSDDAVRIIEQLKKNVDLFNKFVEIIDRDEWMVIYTSKKQLNEMVEYILNEVNTFPLSNYQKHGKSAREEGKMYLKRRHGNDVI